MGQFKPEHADIELERPFEIGNLEMHVANVNPGSIGLLVVIAKEVRQKNRNVNQLPAGRSINPVRRGRWARDDPGNYNLL